jgi:hypothetical protein
MPSRQQIAQPGQPVQYVVYERPRPRIAKGILVLLLAGPIGLIIFAMGQTVWGALWRAWLTMIVLYVVITMVFR